jgi:hypothetical protein
MRLALLFSIVLSTMAAALPAAAQESLGPPPEEHAVKASASPERFLPGAVAPEAGEALVTGLGWGGYDGATHAPLVGALAEARIGSRLVIGVGATYAAASETHPGTVRPSFMARVQLLDAARHGVDGGVAVAYREDRFVDEDGFFQAAVSVGRRSSTYAWVANAAFGSDGEGDDREGDLRLAGLRRVARNLHLGLDGQVRQSLDSTDPRRTAHGTPSFAYMAGPVAALMLGPLALTLEGGMSGARTDTMHNGMAALGSVGAVF